MIAHVKNNKFKKTCSPLRLPVILLLLIFTWYPNLSSAQTAADTIPYPIVDTAQIRCYSNNAEIEYPKANAAFFGQDAQYNGNQNYGKNDFKDHNNGTVTDQATGLMWIKLDSGKLKAGKNKDGKMNWREALKWAENLEYAGYSDWRLPNVKELQSIVDYTRSPATTNSAAIDPIFQTTSFIAESGKADYPCYWTGTTHAGLYRYSTAAYLAFGRSFGWMQNRRNGRYMLMDVHGAGSQRSDPKMGDPSRFPYGRGPQGDVIRIYNFVRCVRGGIATPRLVGPKVQMIQSPQRPQQMRPGMGPNNQRPRRGNFIRRLDRNRDGKISASEFDGPADHFNVLDRNNDGYLSESEAPQGPPPRAP